MKRSLFDRLFDIGNISLMSLIGLLMLFPFYYVLVVSFTDPIEYVTRDLILWPHDWSIAAYRHLLSTSMFVDAAGISVFLATVGTAISLVVTAAGAYALSRKRLQGRKLLLFLILLTTLFNPGIIPPYLVVRELGLINSIWALILPVATSGWYLILMKGFFDSIPEELEESGKMDGCNDLGVWFRIILPLSLPALAAFGLFYAVGYWNTFFSAILYINKPDLRPLQVVLQQLLIDSASSVTEISAEENIPSETMKMAAVIIATVPILLVYPFLQKHFAKGVMLGSVKG